jgi:Cu/Zn superoxide dismutase
MRLPNALVVVLFLVSLAACKSDDTEMEAQTTAGSSGAGSSGAAGMAVPTAGTSGGSGGCAVGSEGCPCTAGSGCDPGLACASDLCVDLGAAGNSAGNGGSAGEAGAAGMSPIAMATASAAIEPFGMGWGTAGGMGTAGVGTAGVGAAGTTGTPGPTGMAGIATFRQDGTGVFVEVTLTNCPDGMHGVHIHQGTSCDTAETQGAHWDMTRGEGIPDVLCSGGRGSSMATRMATPPETAWSVGGDAATNVVGHAFVVHGQGMPPERIACGVIMMQ